MANRTKVSQTGPAATTEKGGAAISGHGEECKDNAVAPEDSSRRLRIGALILVPAACEAGVQKRSAKRVAFAVSKSFAFDEMVSSPF